MKPGRTWRVAGEVDQLVVRDASLWMLSPGVDEHRLLQLDQADRREPGVRRELGVLFGRSQRRRNPMVAPTSAGSTCSINHHAPSPTSASRNMATEPRPRICSRAGPTRSRRRRLRKPPKMAPRNDRWGGDLRGCGLWPDASKPQLRPQRRQATVRSTGVPQTCTQEQRSGRRGCGSVSSCGDRAVRRAAVLSPHGRSR